MFCPKCGCHAGPDASRFCRNCGIRLDGVIQLLARNGAPDAFAQSLPTAFKPVSPRKKGIKKGGKVLFGTIAFLPLIIGLCFLFDSPGPLIFPLTSFFAGLMRMLYARIFEENVPEPAEAMAFPPLSQPVQLPPQPVSFLRNDYQAPVYSQTPQLPQASAPTTGNLEQPPSVAEPTTNLLKQR